MARRGSETRSWPGLSQPLYQLARSPMVRIEHERAVELTPSFRHAVLAEADEAECIVRFWVRRSEEGRTPGFPLPLLIPVKGDQAECPQCRNGPMELGSLRIVLDRIGAVELTQSVDPVIGSLQVHGLAEIPHRFGLD